MLPSKTATLSPILSPNFSAEDSKKISGENAKSCSRRRISSSSDPGFERSVPELLCTGPSPVEHKEMRIESNTNSSAL